MKTENLFDGVKIRTTKGVIPEEVAGVTDNAGEVKSGFCFFAVKGETHELCRSGSPKNRERRILEMLHWFEKYL